MANVAELLDLAVDLAQRAGQLLLDEAPDRAHDVGTKSSRTDMVTAVDRASEALIVDWLHAGGGPSRQLEAHSGRHR